MTVLAARCIMPAHASTARTASTKQHSSGAFWGLDGKLDRHREWEAALPRREWACHSVTSAATINDDQDQLASSSCAEIIESGKRAA